MENVYKVRIHLGRMETKYGVDVATLIDDPNAPNYTHEEVFTILKDKLGYTDTEDENSDYPGTYDEEVGAYFDYDGYIDVNIPQSIIDRIRAEK